MSRSYSELVTHPTFLERFEYLKLSGEVGSATFGSERYLNQHFYNSSEWKRARQYAIARDRNCDLGIAGREIYGRVYIHHINPITPEDLVYASENLFSLENLITVTHQTHNAIHYGDANNLQKDLVERRPGDTIFW